MSIRKLIIEYLTYHQDFQIKGKILDYVKTRAGCYEEVIARKCRKLENLGELEKRIISGKVYYRLANPEPNKVAEMIKMLHQNDKVPVNSLF
jgi:hypothetical protein